MVTTLTKFVRFRPETYSQLVAIGKKNQSFDDNVSRLLDNAGTPVSTNKNNLDSGIGLRPLNQNPTDAEGDNLTE